MRRLFTLMPLLLVLAVLTLVTLNLGSLLEEARLEKELISINKRTIKELREEKYA